MILHILMTLKQNFCYIFFSVSLLIYSSLSTDPLEYPTANLSTKWINRPSPVRTYSVQVTPILLRGITGTRFVCGFYCDSDSTACLFSVLIFENRPDSGVSSIIESPQPVWSANRDNPVKVDATLDFTRDGDLILKDADGTLVWSTNTSGKSISGLNLTEEGNLVVFNENNATVWQSFDHPTDCFLPGQPFFPPQKLISSISSSNWSKGLFTLEIEIEIDLFSNISESLIYLTGYVNSNPPQYYFMQQFIELIWNLSTSQFAKLDSDGHLRVYEWSGSEWGKVSELLTADVGVCGYPMVCGQYGVCSTGQCRCPESANDETNYFKLSNYRQPEEGCTPVTPVSCEFSKDHTLVEQSEIRYFFFNNDIENTDIENCKLACLRKCSCKAALFRSGSNGSHGDCFLPTEMFSLMESEGDTYNFTTTKGSRTGDSKSLLTFLKVQNSHSVWNSSSAHRRGKESPVVQLVSILGGSLGLLLLIGIGIFILRRKKDFKESEEEFLDELQGMPTRFSYEDLKGITENFTRKLGEGGFGSVFEGTLSDGTKVAVKRLDGLGHIKKSFLAEVETIGNINHVNLVRLIGFGAEKSHRLLVYEYMCNGSLDKWIFHKNKELSLLWPLRIKVISGIARGLAYLHEECRQKILHLDIKPQNILLDENFEAKVSDFGLSKLIDKEQSRVVTTMRGTPGYLAPEWLSSVITEKVDVYSFGVVVLEILCGRKNFDRSQPEEDMQLMHLFKRKAEEEQLFDMVDSYCEDMNLHEVEVMKMLRIAAWCLQGDFNRRPSMSVVVKVMEGLMEVESDLDFCFTNPAVGRRTVVAIHNGSANIGEFTAILPSVLSGPR